MSEWVLIIWTVTCGAWSCNNDNVMEFATYATPEACREAMLDWTVTDETRGMTPEYQVRWRRRGAQCLERPRNSRPD